MDENLSEQEIEEIEKILKESADNMKIMPYEQRRARLAERLGFSENREEEPVSVKEPAVATNSGIAGGSGFFHNKSKLIVGLAVLFCCILLAIVLPFVLKKETRFLFGNLEQVNCTQQEYETELSAAKLNTPDFSDYNIDLYGLWLTSEKDVKGWGLNYFDEKNECVVYLDFFDKSVVEIQTINDFETLHQTITISKTTIQYHTQKTDGTYNTIALASYKNATYRIQCVSAQEDISGVFRDLFGEE